MEDEEAAKELIVGTDAQGTRLDLWLSGQLGDAVSRSRLQALIRAGAVTRAGSPVTEPKHRVAAGEQYALVVPEAEPAEPLPENLPLEILCEDDALIVVNKPAGLVVHPAPGNWSGTLVNALLYHCGDTLAGIGGVRRPGIVHRLDRDTSGVMVAAKTDQAHRALSEAFADHGRSGDLERAYSALVWDAPDRWAGTVDAPLGRDPRSRTLRAVVPEGRADARHAVTHYQVQKRYGSDGKGGALAALIECRLETGRTHQIRVHMAHIGHPLIGDLDYGRAFRTKVNRLPDAVRPIVAAFGRQALHARLLAFRHPVTGEPMRFEAPPPPDMTALTEALNIL
ncbi:ribosomal large subunit pseudouridine synthase D [Nitratireductor pacificus pht-3B]|uniref:Pseudouridine synthase n=1 Tax=Nitratireductor pacificus pht-3B TaxID=391937 RepID=K2LLZ7_9HYPH|nr:ribosomal large subunit pseudouridine synthase D [Nitratireductor pacificus pht-3B]